MSEAVVTVQVSEKMLINGCTRCPVYMVSTVFISLLLQILHMNYVSNRVNFLFLLDNLFADGKPVASSKLDLKHFHDLVGYYFIEMTYTQSSLSLESDCIIFWLWFPPC